MPRLGVFACVLAAFLCTGGAETTVPAQEYGSLQPDAGALEDAETADVTSDIWDAAKAGDLDAISRYLATGADANQPDGRTGVTPLSWAAMLGHTEAVNLLIEQGADVDCRNRDGATPLLSAAFLGQAKPVRLLIENGADVNARNNAGYTPLAALAADWGTTQFVAGLLRIKVDRKRVEAGRKTIAQLLRQHGAKEGWAGLAVLAGVMLFFALLGLAISVVVGLITCLVLASALKALPKEHLQIEQWQVWLLVIPCFNLAWNFFVLPKVSRSYESYFQAIGRTDVDVAAQLGWLYCVCTVATVISRIAGLVSLVLLIVYLVKLHGYKKLILAGEISPDGETQDIESASESDPVPTPPPASRRHDLDALRAIAMLAGIGLHGALSFISVAWPVQDSRQNEYFRVLMDALHGFRMPLFFLLSGFFTAMLWRRRGLRALLRHRFQRIFLPMVLGLITIVPAVNGVSIIAIVTAPENATENTTEKTLADPPSVRLYGKGIQAEREREEGGLRGLLWGVALLVMYTPFFHHLWFLWYLCWLVAAFAVYAVIADRRQWRGPPEWLVLSPVRYLWLLPLTMIPQACMGFVYPTFGPDTATGIVPAPHVLLYYGIFFGFGVLYYDTDDETGSVGRWWWLALPIALFVLLPLGIDFVDGRFGFREQVEPTWHGWIANILQVAYAWLMTFGCMGAFRRLLSRESRAMRYISDSSYWLYLAHVPLIIAAQAGVRSWPLPATVKFLLVCTVVSGFLLFTYQVMVRYTWIGAILNGPRKRPERADDTTTLPSTGPVQ